MAAGRSGRAESSVGNAQHRDREDKAGGRWQNFLGNEQSERLQVPQSRSTAKGSTDLGSKSEDGGKAVAGRGGAYLDGIISRPRSGPERSRTEHR